MTGHDMAFLSIWGAPSAFGSHFRFLTRFITKILETSKIFEKELQISEVWDWSIQQWVSDMA